MTEMHRVMAKPRSCVAFWAGNKVSVTIMYINRIMQYDLGVRAICNLMFNTCNFSVFLEYTVNLYSN